MIRIWVKCKGNSKEIMFAHRSVRVPGVFELIKQVVNATAGH